MKVAIDPTAFDDNCAGETISNDFNNTSSLAGAVFPAGTTTVTWTVTDASGNTATCSFNVVVNDTQDPTISCEAVLRTVMRTGENVRITASQRLTPQPLMIIVLVRQLAMTLTMQVHWQVPCSLWNNRTVDWTITDASGNTATCSFDVVVSDNENPSISCPYAGDIPRIADLGECGYTVQGDEFDATVTDNCAGSTVTYSLSGATPSGTGTTLANVQLAVGTTTITWTATDAAGNPMYAASM